MRRSTLKATSLVTAILEYADLMDANLKIANLTNATHVSGVPHSSTHMGGTSLTKANLSGADLMLAVQVTLEQIKGAAGDESTLLPYPLERPAQWVDEQGRGSALLRRLRRRLVWLWHRTIRLIR
jgi:hypothetical protein